MRFQKNRPRIETGDNSSIPTPRSWVLRYFCYRTRTVSLLAPTSPSDHIRTGDRRFPRNPKLYLRHPLASSGNLVLRVTQHVYARAKVEGMLRTSFSPAS